MENGTFYEAHTFSKLLPQCCFHFVLGLKWWLLSIPENFSTASSEQETLTFQGHWLEPIYTSWGNTRQLPFRSRKQWWSSISLPCLSVSLSVLQISWPGFCSRMKRCPGRCPRELVNTNTLSLSVCKIPFLVDRPISWWKYWHFYGIAFGKG